MIKLHIVILFLLLYLSGASQSFKDIYEAIPQNDRLSNVLILREYQFLNPDHAIPYFLLAEMNDLYMRETDPVHMFNMLKSYHREVQVYYGLVKYRLDEKQARQDREFYGDIEITTDKNKVTLPDILLETERRLDAADNYFEKAEAVHMNYINCVNKYNQCLFKFRDILEIYANYKDLYLLTTPKLKADIEQIAMDFDSSLIYFDAYQLACAQLPHLMKVNEYRLKPITTYRLEGLIEANFEAEVVDLWDFKIWANQFISNLNNDVFQIKNGLLMANRKFDDQIEQLIEKDVFSDEMSFFKPEDKFQNLIAKYDYASICNELIDYRNQKVNYLINTRKEINNPRDSSAFFLINKLWFYRDLSSQQTELNEQVSKLQARITIEDIGKYLEFFQKEFNGMDGFARWCEVEKYRNVEVLNKNLNHLLNFIDLEEQANQFTDSVFIWNGKIIPFGRQMNIDPVSDTIYSVDLFSVKGGWKYILGIEYGDSIPIPILSKVNNMGKVEKFLKFDEKLHNELKNFEVFDMWLQDDSIATVIGTIQKDVNDSVSYDIAVKFNLDWNYNLVNFFELTEKAEPAYYWADEINEEYTLLTRETGADSLFALDTFRLGLYSFSDSLLWEYKFAMNGELSDIVFTNSDLFLFVDYDTIEVSDINFKSEDSGFGALYLKRDGQFSHYLDIKTKDNCALRKVVKITSSEINLIGISDVDQSPWYTLIDEKGNLIFSNDHEIHIQNLSNSSYNP